MYIHDVQLCFWNQWQNDKKVDQPFREDNVQVGRSMDLERAERS